MKKNKKYGLGGNVGDNIWDYLNLQNKRGILPTDIESPDTAIAQHNINMAKASKAVNNNIFTKGLDVLGNLGIQVGSQIMTQGAGNDALSNFLKNNTGTFTNLVSTLGNSGRKYAKGGVVINAEDKEIVETPNGNMTQLQGKTHEQGGIDLQVPKGSVIFSDRVKGSDGKTMAERKQQREKTLFKFEKKIKNNPTDNLLKKTYERVKGNFSKIEEADIAIMEALRQKEEQSNMQNSNNMFAKGGFALDEDPRKYYLNRALANSTLGDTEPENTFDGIVDVNKYLWKGTPYLYGNDTTITNDTNTKNPNWKGIPYPLENTEKEKIDISKILKSNQITFGDAIGLGGQLYSTMKPMENTLANRAGDNPNINFFKNFGKNSLKTLESGVSNIKQNQELNLKDLDLNKRTTGNLLRNSARSVNTQRALDLSNDLNSNISRNQIYNNTNNNLANFYSQKASLQSNIDQAVMTGEQNRNLADIQDRDNFHTQLARDIATKGIGLQHIGKNINNIKERNVTNKLLENMYDNYYVNPMNGELVSKKSTAANDLSFINDMIAVNRNTNVPTTTKSKVKRKNKK